MSDDYRLLITGSRKATPAMLLMATDAVLHAKQRGWHIIVGDAEGVDLQVMKACELYDVPYTCYGITKQPRNGHPTSYIQVGNSYPERDWHMAEMCNRCFAIWNGKSRGTMITYAAAKQLGKQVDLRKFQP